MIRTILLFNLFLILNACIDTKKTTITAIGPDISEDDLLGSINRNDLSFDWFDNTYADYQTKSELLSSLQSQKKGINFKIFLGSWCSDSHREIPALFKIFDQIALDSTMIDLVAVNEDKNKPAIEIENYQIEFVPTIILLAEGKEIGRIIESPTNSLEEDLLEILRLK